MPLTPVYIENLQPYKPGKPIDEVKREYGLERIIKMASNENPLGVSPQAIQAMIGSIHQINRYPDISSMVLRTKLSEIHKINMNKIITAHGSEAIMSVAVRTFVHGDEEIITSEGTFVGFYVICNARGSKMFLVPQKNYHFDLPAIASRINSKTKLIYLVNPNNPTGTIFTRKEFEEFMKHVPPEVLVILDEAYYEFVSNRPDFPDSMDYRFDNVITLRTFSKAHGLAGIRLGYGFAREEIVNYLLKVRLPFEPGIPSQMAGVAALTDHQFLNYYLELNQKGKIFLYDTFERLGINYIKSETNFIMCVFDNEERVMQITEKLLQNGIIVRPLRGFGLPHCLRITIGLPEENEIFADKLEKVL